MSHHFSLGQMWLKKAFTWPLGSAFSVLKYQRIRYLPTTKVKVCWLQSLRQFTRNTGAPVGKISWCHWRRSLKAGTWAQLSRQCTLKVLGCQWSAIPQAMLPRRFIRRPVWEQRGIHRNFVDGLTLRERMSQPWKLEIMPHRGQTRPRATTKIRYNQSWTHFEYLVIFQNSFCGSNNIRPGTKQSPMLHVFVVDFKHPFLILTLYPLCLIFRWLNSIWLPLDSDINTLSVPFWPCWSYWLFIVIMSSFLCLKGIHNGLHLPPTPALCLPSPNPCPLPFFYFLAEKLSFCALFGFLNTPWFLSLPYSYTDPFCVFLA